MLLVDDVLDHVFTGTPLFGLGVEKNRPGENFRKADVFVHWTLRRTGALWARGFRFAALATAPPHLSFIEK